MLVKEELTGKILGKKAQLLTYLRWDATRATDELQRCRPQSRNHPQSPVSLCGLGASVVNLLTALLRSCWICTPNAPCHGKPRSIAIGYLQRQIHQSVPLPQKAGLMVQVSTNRPSLPDP